MLPRPPALKSRGGVTAIAVASELTGMHVVLLVARNAVPGKLDLRRGLPVTVRALELAVRAKQTKSSLLEVVVLPQCPTVGIVATVALFTQSALVHVVLAVAIHAMRTGIGERLRAVALGTADDIM